MALSNPPVMVPTAAENDSEMHVDEEGRPRFAPAKNTVSNRERNSFQMLTKVRKVL
jgi:hypothetical protein